ncbi:host-nuclease inhibitor Gam family protein [Moraxella bovoculi]|uniref:host-nuclease inhibitor Gam family protein n=1 Tax=Moraxella bovoculi TaxID=386891 RepID=UPI000B02B97F|nr:host-nuclease inhibitor Gam family protein [Moraxella bovoculi]
MKKPNKTKAVALQACQSLDEAQAIIKTIGEHNREIARLTGQMNDEVADITQSYAEKINPLKLAIDTLTPQTANLVRGEPYHAVKRRWQNRQSYHRRGVMAYPSAICELA